MKRKKRDEKRWEMVIQSLYSLPFFYLSVPHHRLGHLGFTLSFNKLARRHCHLSKKELILALADHLSRLWTGTHCAQWLDFLNTVHSFFFSCFLYLLRLTSFSNVADHERGKSIEIRGPSIARIRECR